jgi:UDP-N-acetylmuramate--alanine ligase
MSQLAEVLRNRGIAVTGSDQSDGPTVQHLKSLGIDVKIGHHPDNVAGADFVIRTAAAHDDNVEIAQARSLGIPVFERAQVWGLIMRSYKNAVCIAGTHGKTTTTSMTTHILLSAGLDPTVAIGGTLPKLNAGHYVGKGDVIVLESCEYCNSFLSFFPTVAVILNVDADHLDFFKDLDDIKASFRRFASLVPDNGYIVCNADDQNTMDTLRPLGRALLTFGFGESAAVRAINIVLGGNGSSFDILCDGSFFNHINLNVPGRHNILNALAATAAARTLGVGAEAIADGLSDFIGAGRRFEYKGTVNGARIYDDYAHHPWELHSLLDGVDTLDYRRVLLVFQPHTYSRTKALFDDFIPELKRPDLVYLAEIYAAREQNTIGISSGDLAAAVPGAVFCPSFEEIERKVRAAAQPGDIILTVGAGDVYKIGELLAGQGQQKCPGAV